MTALGSLIVGGMSAPAADDVLPVHLATVVFPENHPLRGQKGDVMGCAIRHKHGIVLFDTGIGAGNAFIDLYYEPVRRSLADALAEHGHQLSDVTAVINSHLHFDHCGNNHLLPGIPIYAQTCELDLGRGPLYTVPEWIDFPGAEYRLVDGDARIAAGIRIIATPGHTSGHQSVVLDYGDRPIVLAGQAIYSKAECELIAEKGTLSDDDPPPDPDGYLASANRILELRPRRVHFSHDAAIWNG